MIYSTRNSLAAMAMLSTALHAADLKIDHVTVAGKDLSRLETQLASAGLKTERGGPHSNHATEMAIASFPDGSYIELIAIQANADKTMLVQHAWSKFITGDAGPCAWAVRPRDFGAEVERVRSNGIPAKVVASGRTRPDGVALEWETAAIGSDGTGVFFPFLIRDKTPGEKRAFPSGKAANRDQTGILRVVIAVKNLPDAVQKFNVAYPVSGNGSGKPLKQVDPKFGAELAWLPDSPVVFAKPLGASSWIADRIAHFGEGPCAFVLSGKKDAKGEWYSEGRWFGRDMKWFDPEKLGGWWLGVEVQ